MSEKSTATVRIENERTRVSESRFAPGAETGFHRHEHDYVVVPLTTGQLKLIGPGGEESFGDLTLGEPYFRNAGVEHNVINNNDYEFAFIEIELK